MLKNFRNGVLAQLMLLAVVGCSMTLHATTLTCTSTIDLGAGGVVLGSQITGAVCVQVGDKVFGDFKLGNLPTGNNVFFTFGSNSATNRASITLNSFAFAAGVAYNFGYQVEVTNPANVISTVAADVIQTIGTSSLSAILTPAGTGTINFTRTGSGSSSPNTVTFTPTQGVTDLTINETFTKQDGSDTSAVLNSIEQTRVPEPGSLMLLSSGMLGLVSFRCRRFLKR